MFLTPWLLLGLLATAIPLVLHLRKSTMVKRITFSTTRFFDEQFIRSSRRARFQDLLLMLLRIALLLLFVLALAQPLLKRQRVGIGNFAERRYPEVGHPSDLRASACAAGQAPAATACPASWPSIRAAF